MLNVSTSDSGGEGRNNEEEDVVLLMRKFKNFFKEKKRRFDQHKGRGSSKNHYKMNDLIFL